MTNGHYREVFPAGKLQQSVTSVTVANNTAKTIDTTVPSGKRWILLSIRVTNPDDVQRTINIYKFKEAAKTNEIARFISNATNAGGRVHWPYNASPISSRVIPSSPAEIFDAGNTLSVVWAAGGVSGGGTDADGLVIEYLEVDV